MIYSVILLTLFTQCIDAPLSIKNLTASTCPLSAARWTGVDSSYKTFNTILNTAAIIWTTK